ncbi:DUF2332 domain-containing protein [Iamia sp. SCSIO 61187]|uniref:DUF2332 domain-containing protein n=1 Tax=Iamia sp. SCSIO 61187 TaxID=2722752 RepID=UPI001C63AC04|nr:DUF2332 domain-containing protein [Iamia sp. SCSIO 61187]QYG95090.1 DUF2332 domain-containing protein [Iamia sp. SCSIO 61187]
MDLAAADLPALADLWRWCATEDYTDSVLYRAIAARVADDHELIGLTVAAGPPHAQFPHVLMAAVHELVLLGAAPDLAAHYGGDAPGDPFPAFRATCLAHREALLARMATRFTNTNEVGRSAVIALALAHVTAPWDAWALVEGGASAGINLCYDRFHLDYGPAGTLGDPTSSVHVTCEDRGGALVVPDALALPRERVGLDLDPVDLTDDDERRWLLACTWPDTGRLARTAAAHELVAADPPRVVVGDVVTDLPGLLAATAPELPAVVLTTWVVGYLTPDQRAAFAAGLAAASRTRPVTWVSAEGRGAVPLGPVDLGPPDGGTAPGVLGAISYAAGDQVGAEVLAVCHPHGRWVDWRAPGPGAGRSG